MNAIMPTTERYTDREIITEIEIEASHRDVWKILTDFQNYESWNPFIVKSQGKLELGSTITNHMELNGKINEFSPEITLIKEGEHFEWIGKAPLGAFVGNHYFILKPMGMNRCKLIHGERFSGWMRTRIMKRIGQETFENFKRMNQALKEVAEKE